MHLMRFDHAGQPALGIRLGSHVVPVAPLGFGDDPIALCMANPATRRDLEAAAASTTERLPVAGLAPLPPIAAPGKIICIGLNYALHAKEGGNPIPDYPAVFIRVATSFVPPGQPFVVPAASSRLDYEAELAIVMGRRAARVSEADALEHVAGYACFNDGSVRDYQRKSSQWTMGKNFDATASFGPDLVTADALPPGAAPLRIRTRVNGETLQDSTTGDMIFPVARIIAILSEVMTLDPGDVIATGTPSGVGYARQPPVFLRPGDLCEVEIEGVGILASPVVAA